MEKNGVIYYLRRLNVNEKFRNMGIGGTIIEELPALMEELFTEYDYHIILKAYPYEETNKEKAKELAIKLEKFYMKHGFKKIKNETMYKYCTIAI